MTRIDAEQNAEDEEEVDYLAGKEADFPRSDKLFIAHPQAADTHGKEVLDVVEDQEKNCDDYRSEEVVRSLWLTFQIEASRQTWITLYVDVVVAIKHHEIGHQNEEEDEQVDLGALVDSLASEDCPLDAAPVSWYTSRSEGCEFTQPVNQETSDKDSSGKFSEGVCHETGRVNVHRVEGIVEAEQR